MGKAEDNKRLHVFFCGRVQGVGFRYTVCRLAEPLDVTGFVRNLWDGDVELVGEGREEELDTLLAEIHRSPLERHISGQRVQWEPASGAFEQFGVSYS